MDATYHLVFWCISASDTMDPSSRRMVVARERVAGNTDRRASRGTTAASHAETSFILVDRNEVPSKIVLA
jgi:hypothetical protein